MNENVSIFLGDPNSPSASKMMDSLWEEIQTRYGFSAPNPMKGEDFSGPKFGFWIAETESGPVGSIALVPWSEKVAELDVMYVDPKFRGTGLAAKLLENLESFANQNGFQIIRLRAGAPQPEALRFYEKAGFYRIDSFGKWASDDTAWCYEKKLS